MITEQTEEEVSLYVLGLLPPEEARRVELAAAADPELAALISGLEDAAAAFGATVAPPQYPPAGIRARIMSRVRGEEPSEPAPARGFRWGVWFPWAVAASLALLAAGLGYERYHLKLLVDDFRLRDAAQQQELDQMQARDVDLQRRLDQALADAAASAKTDADLQAEIGQLRAKDILSQVQIATLASALKNAPQAGAVVAWDAGAQRGILKTIRLPSVHENQDYQLWIIDPGYKQPVSAGVFDPSTGSHFAPVQPISKASQFAVSIEKKGGSAEPQGPIVLIGE